jgi:hypothetical protein
MTLDQGHDQSHRTSLGLVQQFCEILLQIINSVKSYGYSDIDHWPVTLGQGWDTSLGPV